MKGQNFLLYLRSSLDAIKSLLFHYLMDSGSSELRSNQRDGWHDCFMKFGSSWGSSYPQPWAWRTCWGPWPTARTGWWSVPQQDRAVLSSSTSEPCCSCGHCLQKGGKNGKLVTQELTQGFFGGAFNKLYPLCSSSVTVFYMQVSHQTCSTHFLYPCLPPSYFFTAI